LLHFLKLHIPSAHWRLKAWGHDRHGGRIPPEMDFTSVQAVQATRTAFAAILRDQTVASGGLG